MQKNETMSINEYINNNYDELQVIANNLCRKTPGEKDGGYDLLNHTLTSILTSKNGKKTFETENDAKYYITRAMVNQHRSYKSSYYRLYGRIIHLDETDNPHKYQVEDRHNHIDDYMNSVDAKTVLKKIDDYLHTLQRKKIIQYWEGEVYRLKILSYNEDSYQKLAKELNISRSTIFFAVKKVEKLMKEKIQEIKQELAI